MPRPLLYVPGLYFLTCYRKLSYMLKCKSAETLFFVMRRATVEQTLYQPSCPPMPIGLSDSMVGNCAYDTPAGGLVCTETESEIRNRGIAYFS